MTRFVGGPHDGLDLPLDPQILPQLRLPEFTELGDFLGDPRLTDGQTWPHQYAADMSAEPPVFRYVEPQ